MEARFSRFLPPTLLLALSALLSRVLGVVRDHLLAKTFGATAGSGLYDLDTYYAAFRIPDLIYNLLVVGAVSAAFIPLFTQHRKEKDLKNAWMFASSVLHLMLLAVVVVSGVLYLIAPWVAHWVAGGFSAEQIGLTAHLMRIMLLSPFLFAITSVLIGIQDSFKTFFYRSLGPLLYNLGIIAGIVWWGKSLGVVGVTFGVLLGAFLQCLVQIPSLWEVGYRHVWTLGLARPDVRKAMKLLVPRVIGGSVDQVILLMSTFIASFFGTGSITVLTLANNLQSMPLGIIGVSFAITSFATLSELASEPTSAAFVREVKQVISRVLFLTLPAIAGMLVLKEDLIRVLFGYGKFTAADARLTSIVLGVLVVSLFAQSLLAILARGFYAYHDTKTPLLSGAAGGALALGGGLLLGVSFKLGIVGVALGISLGDLLDFALMYRLLSRKVGHDVMEWKRLFRMLVASLLMGVGVYGIKSLYPIQGLPLTQLALLLAYGGLGIALYFGLASLLGLSESQLLLGWLKKPAVSPPQDSDLKTPHDLAD